VGERLGCGWEGVRGGIWPGRNGSFGEDIGSSKAKSQEEKGTASNRVSRQGRQGLSVILRGAPLLGNRSSHRGLLGKLGTHENGFLTRRGKKGKRGKGSRKGRDSKVGESRLKTRERRPTRFRKGQGGEQVT